MAEKVILVADPGIDAAFAIALALNDPDFEVLAVAATAGNVSAEQATRNVHTVIAQIDPPRLPRVGSAPHVEYEQEATDLHGPDGLGGHGFPSAELHHPTPSDKVIADTIRQHPNEVSVLLAGPATALALAIDRDPELPRLINKLVVVGGAWHEAGDVSACAEFHFWCDPASARQVLRSGAPLTLLPLDVTNKFIFSPNEIRHFGSLESRTAAFLGKVVPMLLAPTAGRYGIEGAYLADAMAVAFLTRPAAFTLKPVAADVETRGELTRGMSVFDTRWSASARPNIDVATAVDVNAVRGYIHHLLTDALA